MKTITNEQISVLLPEIELIKNEEWKRAVYLIWKEAFEASNWNELSEAQFNPLCPRVTLINHTRAVTQGAVSLTEIFKNLFGIETDQDQLIVSCLLHDVCKLLESDPFEESSKKNEIGRTYQHGFLSAYYAQREGLPSEIIASLISHTGHSRTIPKTIEGLALYYSDVANADFLRAIAGVPLLMEKYK